MHTVAALWAATASCAQWNFTLDTTFRTTILDENVNAIHVLPDGKLFASGRIRYPGDFSVRGSARLLSNGQRDFAFPMFPQTTGSGKITPWVDGKFYVGTTVVRRMLPDGLIDPTFVTPGTGPYYAWSTTGDYHVFPDGRVLMSGSHTLSDTVRGFVGSYELIWFTNTGYLDTTRTHRNANGPIWEFKELPSGQFICTCNCSQYDGQPVSKLFRVHSDGELDTNFQPGINWGNIFAYHGLPDGGVYVGGRYKSAAAPNDTLYLARFMADGSLDPTFIPPLVAMGTLDADYGPSVVHLLPWYNGHLIASGEFGHVDQQPRGSIFMVDSSGTLTNAFTSFQAGVYLGQFGNSAEIVQVVQVSEDTLYICGAFVGCNDGTTNDTLQRFVSRLLVSELPTGIEQQANAAFSVFPNPVTTTATVEMERMPPGTLLVLRDALGREVLRQRVTDHYTTLTLERSGVYLLELWDGVGRLATQRIVVE